MGLIKYISDAIYKPKFIVYLVRTQTKGLTDIFEMQKEMMQIIKVQESLQKDSEIAKAQEKLKILKENIEKNTNKINYELNQYVFVTKIIVSQTTTFVSYNNRTYMLDLRKPLFIKFPYFYYYIDIDSGASISFYESEVLISPEIIDAIVREKTVEKMVKGIQESQKLLKLVPITLGFVIGGLLLFMITSLLYENGVLVP